MTKRTALLITNITTLIAFLAVTVATLVTNGQKMADENPWGLLWLMMVTVAFIYFMIGMISQESDLIKLRTDARNDLRYHTMGISKLQAKVEGLWSLAGLDKAERVSKSQYSSINNRSSIIDGIKKCQANLKSPNWRKQPGSDEAILSQYTTMKLLSVELQQYASKLLNQLGFSVAPGTSEQNLELDQIIEYIDEINASLSDLELMTSDHINDLPISRNAIIKLNYTRLYCMALELNLSIIKHIDYWKKSLKQYDNETVNQNETGSQ